ncbi:prolipoprotein diacylglyceryl transferase family protein [Rubinisphaera sp.]|uniref:prolipoprotein diacylglyceryl transferase n=1 Tax=Rubinisphaera sp. TaxID=2024857 RepID=UPI000C106387|nr:prolipoprotein diacylglyceryl transferase family protein [Rubinisphaera sp.]MBV08960.1 diacylglyceryl transferase [Rubinisphaera sp.]HCS53353.1 diacylglyceryl transferase [Planctomycetaceae bacterium]|tara:strand:+ start:3737 stop:4447 length:711 start_codon:yes stop_codon:yes gene_type:complete
MTWLYPVIMLAAIVCTSLLLRRSQSQLPLTRQQKFAVGLGAFCGAMIGAKLPFAIAHAEGVWALTSWISHGKTIVCGLVGGYFGVELAKSMTDVKVKTGDSFAVPVAVGIAIGRLACFQAGCCYGTPTDLPWGIPFPTASGPILPRHPTQIYEFSFHLIAAIVLFVLQSKGLFRGQLMKLYIISYLGYRFLTEWIRPEPIWYGSLTAYQWGCLVLIPVFILLWVHDARQQNRIRAV